MLTIGTDPEFFLKKDGKYVSSETYTIGTKKTPVNISLNEYYYVGVQRDNVAIEFACDYVIVDMQDTSRWIRVLKNAVQSMYSILPSDVEIVCEPSAFFPEDELQSRLAMEFGCEPDYNAYTGQINEKPPAAMNATFRSCGGHVHLGYDDPDRDIERYEFLMNEPGHRYVIQVMDIILGLPCTILDNSQAAIDRRSLYGSPGSYRPTSYGVEYRTLSNFWMKTPDLARLIYKLAAQSAQIASSGQLMSLQEKCGGADEIINIIETGDSDKAMHLYKKVLAHYILSSTRLLFEECLKTKDVYTLKTIWRTI